MPPNTEYAKLVKSKTDNLSDRGFQAKIKLPSSKTLPRVYDYINFYCGIDSYECGLSCKDNSAWKQGGVLKWRVFANGNGATTYGSTLYADGSTVKISLELDTSNKVVYKVNDVVIKTFATPLNNITNSARLIFGALQYTGYTPPLKVWDVKHNQVYASEMKYKNSSNNWIAFTNGSKVTTEEWPPGVPTPDGRKYTVDKASIGSSKLYASLKF